MEKKIRIYTEEQEEKIERLRREAEKERVEKNKRLEISSEETMDLKPGSPVFITVGGKTISGYVKLIHGKGFDAVYEVNSPLGRIKGLSRRNLRARFVEDLSHIEIPEELKKYSVGNLLKMLNLHRRGIDGYYGPKFTESEIKAELRLRPHVPTKGEKKIFKKYTK